LTSFRASTPELQPGYKAIYLTVDVEEYYHAEAFSGIIGGAEQKKNPLNVEKNTMELLRLFHECNARGTFFVLGCIAEKYPGLIRSILESGHEIASHGTGHRMVTRMTPIEFREDVRKSRQILEDITGKEVLGYRAPTFSIVKRTEWAYEILRDEGFQYSSSVFPIRHDRYGWATFGLSPRKMAVRGDRWIWEVPLSVERIGGVNLPFGGGGYLRLYPMSLTKYFFRRLLRNGRPAVVYVHPWEIDREHPQVAMPVLKRIRHYVGITGMEEKVRDLLRSFPFERMDEFLKCPPAVREQGFPAWGGR
jgi:polysaccharide deacetylase family protein (PEP-CTERM system associated)